MDGREVEDKHRTQVEGSWRIWSWKSYEGLCIKRVDSRDSGRDREMARSRDKNWGRGRHEAAVRADKRPWGGGGCVPYGVMIRD